MKRLLIVVLSCCMLSIAYGQTPVTKESYTVSGGLLGAANISNFRTDKDVSPNVDYSSQFGWGLGGWVNFPITNHFSIEPQLQYNSYQFKTSSTAADLLLYDGKIRYISLPILLKLHAGKAFAFTLGPQFDFRTSIEDNNNVADKEHFKSSNISLSAGLELFPRSRVSLFGRYLLGFSNVDDRTNHGTDTREYKVSNVQVGLKFRLFGGTKKETAYEAAPTPAPLPPLDSDGDGITDDMDKCPSVAGLAKYNGCPIPDTDGDGINDELDKCINVAGLAKYNGCPIPDSDGDGINDEEDKCPNQAGTAKYNGCPVPDKDGDGINDEEDKCPDIVGVSSNKGCPEVPSNVSKTLGTEAMKVKFTGTTTTLNATSKAALDKIVALMNEHPGMSISVGAHTDNAGDDDKNMTLTQDRANAVKDYIVSKGIDASRVTAEGFGETMPIADNATASGRTKNRRVEIKLNY